MCGRCSMSSVSPMPSLLQELREANDRLDEIVGKLRRFQEQKLSKKEIFEDDLIEIRTLKEIIKEIESITSKP